MKRFIITDNKIKKLIFLQNSNSINEVLNESFNESGILVSKMNFIFSLDIISIYDRYPEEFMKLNLIEFQSMEKLIKILVKELVEFIFKELDYKDSYAHLFKELYSFNIAIKTFPIDIFTFSHDNSLNKNREKVYLENNEIKTKIFKFLHQFRVLSSFYKRELKENSTVFFCSNENCSSPVISINTQEISYFIDINTKTLYKTTLKSNCSKCASVLTKKLTNIQSYLFYKLNILNDLYIKTSINGVQFEDKELNDESFEKAIVLGYFDRNKRGYWEFKILSRLCMLDHNFMSQNRDKPKIQIENTNLNKMNVIDHLHNKKQKTPILIKNLTNIIKENINFKTEITLTDIKIFTVINILNCELHDNLYLTALSSPLSITQDLEITKQCPNQRKQIFIYTNDVNYITYIAKSMTNSHIFYSLKSFKKYSKYYQNTLCILDYNQNLKNLESQDLEFAIDVEGDCFCEHSYNQTEPIEQIPRICRLSEKDLGQVNEIFTEQRKRFKSVMEPYKLLKRIEEIALSLKSLTNSSESLLLIEQYFMKIICR